MSIRKIFRFFVRSYEFPADRCGAVVRKKPHKSSKPVRLTPWILFSPHFALILVVLSFAFSGGFSPFAMAFCLGFGAFPRPFSPVFPKFALLFCSCLG